jgi:hypothetical protein
VIKQAVLASASFISFCPESIKDVRLILKVNTRLEASFRAWSFRRSPILEAVHAKTISGPNIHYKHTGTHFVFWLRILVVAVLLLPALPVDHNTRHRLSISKNFNSSALFWLGNCHSLCSYASRKALLC